MTMIGLAHYGGTLGLYNQPDDEIVRALAYYRDRDERRIKQQKERERERLRLDRERMGR